ncbi:RNA-directed DNA polymerase, eukaryota [Tanacetum coccineum]
MPSTSSPQIVTHHHNHLHAAATATLTPPSLSPQPPRHHLHPAITKKGAFDRPVTNRVRLFSSVAKREHHKVRLVFLSAPEGAFGFLFSTKGALGFMVAPKGLYGAFGSAYNNNSLGVFGNGFNSPYRAFGFASKQHIALKAASGKVTKHEKACIENQHVFIPFGFDTFGFLAPEAVELLSRVQRVMHSNVMTPRSTDVFNIDRLVKNLCTIWIGRHHLYANKVRFDRPQKPLAPKSNFPPFNGSGKVYGNTSSGFQQPKGFGGSFASVVNGDNRSVNPASLISSSPALVLEDTCIIERDFSRCVMGKVKDFTSIPNLPTILSDEGFDDVKLSYLGGLWVLCEFDSVGTRMSMMTHTGVKSWFQILQDVSQEFVSEERIVWVDIEGVPLYAWSRDTFSRIGKKWGEALNIEDVLDSSFGRKRLCIITKSPTSILETFKIIVRGKVFLVRAKELFTWNPNFLHCKEREDVLEDASVKGDTNKEQVHVNEGEDESFNDSDVEGVAETYFDDTSVSPKECSNNRDEQISDDPFGVYDLLNKKAAAEEVQQKSPSLSHPPGFTPAGSEACKDSDHFFKENGVNMEDEVSPQISAKVMSNSQAVRDEVAIDSIGQRGNNGGSVLSFLEEVIRVGHAMGFSMEGCEKDIEAIIEKQGETKMDRVSHMDTKFMWGNSNYDFVCSDSLGNSGGILCIWEATVFKKDHVTISDNFVAIYGTWIPNNVKVLMVVVYAPQQPLNRRLLWEYLSILLTRWNGEAIIMGDFNDVRNREERRGSWFNPSSARSFDQFILSSGLVDVKMEGYAFTWSHPSATKMSKLDRFLVSEGIISLFPSITSVCLDRHLSDHRPILLRELKLDFGPSPFRFYHSWFSYAGFDEMVEQTWRAFSHSDRNGMIRFKKKLQDLKIIIRSWIKEKNKLRSHSKQILIDGIREIDKELDQNGASDVLLFKRHDLIRKLNDIKEMEGKDSIQKSKVRWAIEGDENSKYFHGIINKKRSQLAIRGVFVDGDWITDPRLVKQAFLDHYEARFKKPSTDDFTFEFFKKYWEIVGPDLCEAVEHFFENGLSRGIYFAMLLHTYLRRKPPAECHFRLLAISWLMLMAGVDEYRGRDEEDRLGASVWVCGGVGDVLPPVSEGGGGTGLARQVDAPGPASLLAFPVALPSLRDAPLPPAPQWTPLSVSLAGLYLPFDASIYWSSLPSMVVRTDFVIMVGLLDFWGKGICLDPLRHWDEWSFFKRRRVSVLLCKVEAVKTSSILHLGAIPQPTPRPRGFSIVGLRHPRLLTTCGFGAYSERLVTQSAQDKLVKARYKCASDIYPRAGFSLVLEYRNITARLRGRWVRTLR